MAAVSIPTMIELRSFRLRKLDDSEGERKKVKYFEMKINA